MRTFSTEFQERCRPAGGPDGPSSAGVPGLEDLLSSERHEGRIASWRGPDIPTFAVAESLEPRELKRARTAAPEGCDHGLLLRTAVELRVRSLASGSATEHNSLT